MASPEIEEPAVEKKEGPPKSSLMSLDEETLLEVFSQLDLASARRLGATCRRLHRISQDPQVDDYSSVGLLWLSVGPAGEVELRTDLRLGPLSRPVAVRRPAAPKAEPDEEEEEDWDREPAKPFVPRKPKRGARNVQGDRVLFLLEQLVGRGLAAPMLDLEGDGTGRWDWVLGHLTRLLPPLVGLRLRGLKALGRDAKARLLQQAAHVRLLDVGCRIEGAVDVSLAFQQPSADDFVGPNFFRPRSCFIASIPQAAGFDPTEEVANEADGEFAHIPEARRPMAIYLGLGTLAYAAGDFRLYDLPARFRHHYFDYLDGSIRLRKGESQEPPLHPPSHHDPYGFKTKSFTVFGAPAREPMGLFSPGRPKASLEFGSFLRLPPLRHPGVAAGESHCPDTLVCGGLDEAGEPVPSAFLVGYQRYLAQSYVCVGALLDLPEPRWGHKFARVIDPVSMTSAHFVLGGARDKDAHQITNGVLRYFPKLMFEPGSVEKWEPAQPMVKARAHFAMGMEGGRVFVAGGLGKDGRPTFAAEVFDFAAGVWAALPDLPLAVQGPAGLVCDGHFWVCGGLDADGASSAQLLSLDLSGAAQGHWGQWETGRAGMGRPRAFHALAALQEPIIFAGQPSARLMAVGGEEDGPTAVELYDPAADAWTTTEYTIPSQPGMTVV